ncbi:hypothetical protein B0H21DRAFT_94161 [Amylocystis lapponica]|nr:hypothetical protein B0H21DRAFT_94161 [Amylocystis lapponica]
MLLVLVFALLSLQGVRAQESNATCYPSYNWMYNSLGQNPCIVASYALGACFPGGFNVLALIRPGDSYTVPASTLCSCSSVCYSLLSACAYCQNGSSYSWAAQTSHCDLSQISNGS